MNTPLLLIIVFMILEIAKSQVNISRPKNYSSDGAEETEFPS